ncbi:MAG: hypothetical protein RIC55_24105 [Pirellulaceae bacterium]
MSPDRIIAVIKQETLRNKKKSAILGVMCLVAGYFWVPLVWGWIAPDDARKDAADDAPAEFVVAAETPAASPPPETTTRRQRRNIPWEELVRRIQEDPRMASADLGPLERSPFGESTTETPPPPETNVEPTAPILSVAQESLAQLDLNLTGIVYGPRFRVATINGTEYHENNQLRLDPPTSNAGTTTQVGPGSDEEASAEQASQHDLTDAAERYAKGEIGLQDLIAMQQVPSGDNKELTPDQRDEHQDAAFNEEASDAKPLMAPARDSIAPAKLTCTIASIRPNYVVLRFQDGTTMELRMVGARIDAADVIQISKTSRAP